LILCDECWEQAEKGLLRKDEIDDEGEQTFGIRAGR